MNTRSTQTNRPKLNPGEFITLERLITDGKLITDEDKEKFHRLRKEALELALKIFDDRAKSYNTEHEAVEEFTYGQVGLVSEIYKKIKRLSGLLWPGREGVDYVDVLKIIDCCVDGINDLSWLYATTLIACGMTKEDIYKDLFNGKEAPKR